MAGRTVLILLSGCFLATVSFLFWGMNKGFDLTDEGAWLLGYTPGQEILNSLTFFNLILGKLFGAWEPRILIFRFLRLVITLLSAAIFAQGFFCWLRDRIPRALVNLLNSNTVFLLISLSTFVSYSAEPQTISYNTLNNFFLLASAGFVFRWLAAKNPVGKNAGLLFAAGVLLGFDFFIKFPSSIILTAAISLLITAGRGKETGLQKAAGLTAFAAGFAAGIFSFFVFFCDFSLWLPNVLAALGSWFSGTHNVSLLLRFYFRMAEKSSLHLLPALFALILLGILFIRFGTFIEKEFRKRPVRAFFSFATILIAAFFYLPFRSLFFKSCGIFLKMPVIFASAAVLSLQGFLLVCFNRKKFLSRFFSKEFLRKNAGAFFLLAIPTAAFIGTNSPVSVLLQHFAPWIALSVILAAALFESCPSQTLTAFTITVLALGAQIQFLNGYIFHPYRLPHPLYRQTESAGLPRLQFIKLDCESKAFIGRIAGIVSGKSGFKPGDPVLAVHSMPGLVYALGGVAPGGPWIHALDQERNCSALKSSRLKELSRTIFLTNGPVHPDFLACLRQCGIDYPGGYIPVGTADFPYRKFYSEIEKEVTVRAPRIPER